MHTPLFSRPSPPRRWSTAAALAMACWAAGLAHSASPFEDSMAQRMLACTSCHGAQGRAAPDGYYPRIAGKPAGYLYHQLLNFRDGRRHYRPMGQMLSPLSDAYLRTMAEHFAGLDLPYPTPSPVRTSPEALQRGETLALHGDARRQVPACVQCHGERLTGVQPATPGLLGLPRDYLNAQMGAWRTGLRRAHAPDCMATIAQRLDAADVSAVASWLASQPLPSDTRPAQASTAPTPLVCGSAHATQEAR